MRRRRARSTLTIDELARFLRAPVELQRVQLFISDDDVASVEVYVNDEPLAYNMSTGEGDWLPQRLRNSSKAIIAREGADDADVASTGLH